MIYIYLVLFFLFSLILGSFLNVVIYRYNTGLSIAKGRSKCFSCGRDLESKDLIPVISYIFYKGRCRTCKSRISIQYPLVELLTASMLTAIFAKYLVLGGLMMDPTNVYYWCTLLVDCIITALLICIAVYDLRHKIIPNGLVYTAALLALVKMIAFIWVEHLMGMDLFLGLVAGPLIAAPFALLWLVSGGRWMGLGDAKLALVIGWMLGISQGFTALIYSFWIGTVVILGGIFLGEAIDAFTTKNNALGIKLFGGKLSASFRRVFPKMGLRTEIPFGPFMIIALYVVYFTGRTLLGLHL